MSSRAMQDGVAKLATRIPGFDLIAHGGLPRACTTLVTGTPGSAKTVFAAQFLARGIEDAGERGVFVTFEERPDQLRRNMAGFGWNIAAWEEEGQWAFVDAAPRPDERPIESGEFDFGGLVARIEHAVNRIGATRVALDSISAVFTQFNNRAAVRHELFRLAETLREMGVTTVITAERDSDHRGIARYSVEEFVADNVVILRNRLGDEKRRRTIEILKFRGTSHQKGEFPFTVSPADGLIVIPLSEMELKQRSSAVRCRSGVPELDAMCGGGFFRDSIVLVTGATGCGKTLVTTEFIEGGVEARERSLLFGFEESRDQLVRNAAGWGIDFDRLERDRLLRTVCVYPESRSLEDHLIEIKKQTRAFRPHRVVVDSLSALERISSGKGFREFVVALTGYVKELEVTGLFTLTTPTLLGGGSVTESHISSIADSILLLRYVELFGEMRRGITVLKMRGSWHEKEIREFTIDDKGMHIGEAFRNVSGILSGNLVHADRPPGHRIEELL